MDKLRLTLTPCEVDALRRYLQDLCTEFHPAALLYAQRKASTIIQRKIQQHARINAILFARLLVRLNISRVIARPKYRFNLPLEQAIALLMEYQSHDWHTDDELIAVMGRIDQALA